MHRKAIKRKNLPNNQQYSGEQEKHGFFITFCINNLFDCKNEKILLSNCCFYFMWLRVFFFFFLKIVSTFWISYLMNRMLIRFKTRSLMNRMLIRFKTRSLILLNWLIFLRSRFLGLDWWTSYAGSAFETELRNIKSKICHATRTMFQIEIQLHRKWTVFLSISQTSNITLHFHSSLQRYLGSKDNHNFMLSFRHSVIYCAHY